MRKVATDDGHERAAPVSRVQTPSECLVVFSKPAIPGRVKTRLIGELSAKQAAHLHSAFLGDLIEEMLCGRFDLRVAWALEPADCLPETSVSSMIQSGEDLGERLFGALAELANHYSRVAAVGSDHPDLSVSLVHEAFDKLQAGSEVVLGPAGDGGYYLVAARGRALRKEIFDDIPWSSSAVLETTLERCRELDLKVDLLATVPDVDTPDDLARLMTNLDRNPDLGGHRTRTLLRSWQGLFPSGCRGENHENP